MTISEERTRPAPNRCAAAVVVSDDRVLLVHRHPRRRWYPDVWDLPGSHLRTDESAADALVRELAEELGINIEAPVRTAPQRIFLPDATLEVWVVRRWQGTPANCAPEEHDTLGWFRLDEIPKLTLAYPTVEDLCALALRYPG
ncbi:MAG: NUDIX domain-containing protein [Candidatus Dormiibacterota bacterium]